MRWGDRIVGIACGVILGVGVIAFFVFVYSDRTVDSPSLSQGPSRGAAKGGDGESNTPPPLATVKVIGGAPPSSGPAELHYTRGELVRLRVVSDLEESVEMPGYGIRRTVPAGRPASIRFRASRTGNFPLIITASHIGVARIAVEQRAP
jgi:hypothetical protein